MNNKKLPLLIAIIVVVIAISAGLFYFISSRRGEGSQPSGGGPPGQTTGSQTTLLYWGLWEPESVMQPLIDEYESQNPNIKIEYINRSFTQYEETSYARIVQGSTTGDPAPDILMINNTWLPKFQPYLSALPTDIMPAAEYTGTFYQTCTDDFTGSDNQIYAIPLSIDGLAVFYNKNLLQEAGYSEPPQDWNTFIEAAKKMTVTNEAGEITQSGVAMGTSNNVKHSADIFNLLLLQNNVEVISETGDGLNATLTGIKAQSAMNFYTDFIKEHNTWSSDLLWDLDLFYSGNLAMMFGPSWRAFDIMQAAPQLEFGIAPTPQLPNNPPVYYAMYWGHAVPETSENSVEAWKFIKFLSEKEQMKQKFSNESKIRAFGEPYSRKDLAGELSDNPYAAPIVEMAPSMDAWVMGDQTYVEDSLRTAINDVAVNNKNASQALSDAEDRINSKLAELTQ
ncbi:extracellular solute-binding protein [Candidatus Dojkabacteria bacterium]|nr:extracellular solute-binding protein [Candidatus Dojkabacteria bacterium]